MGVKRFDLIESIGGEAWLEEAALGEYVKASDYDAMLMEIDALRGIVRRFKELSIQDKKHDRLWDDADKLVPHSHSNQEPK
jgi:hypothetical protein